jgi:hypothetical protein
MDRLHQKLDKTLVNSHCIDSIAEEKAVILSKFIQTTPSFKFSKSTISIQQYGLLVQIHHKLTDMEREIFLNSMQLTSRVKREQDLPFSIDLNKFLELFIKIDENCIVSFNDLNDVFTCVTNFQPKTFECWKRHFNLYFDKEIKTGRSVRVKSVFGRFMEVGKEDIFRAYKGITLCWPSILTEDITLPLVDLDNVKLPIGKINSICSCLKQSDIYLSKCIECLWEYWGVEKKHSNIKNAGYGLFASKMIKKGTRLVYKGDLLPICESFNKEYTFKISNQLVIDASNSKWKWSAARYINHSDKNFNCVFVINQQTKHVYVETIMDIEQGKELFVNYGSDFNFNY